MKSLAVLFAFAIFSVDQTWAMAMPLPADAFERADIIARVRIDDDVGVIPGFRLRRTGDGKFISESSTADRKEYRKLATASVIQAFKGGKTGEKIKIWHTNGYGCPNVIYKTGGEYLVFLTKEPDSSAYVTMCYYNGQFRIEGDQVVRFYLMPEFDFKTDVLIPYATVANFLRDAVAKAKS